MMYVCANKCYIEIKHIASVKWVVLQLLFPIAEVRINSSSEHVTTYVHVY